MSSTCLTLPPHHPQYVQVKKEPPRKHLGVVRIAGEPGAISGTVDRDLDATSLIWPYWVCPRDIVGELIYFYLGASNHHRSEPTTPWRTEYYAF